MLYWKLLFVVVTWYITSKEQFVSRDLFLSSTERVGQFFFIRTKELHLSYWLFFFFNFFLLPLIFLLFTRLSSDIQKKKKNDSKLFVNVLFNYSKYFFRFLSWSSEPIYLISRLHKNVQIKQQKKKRFCSNLLSPPTHNSTSLKTHTHIHTYVTSNVY